MPAVDCLKKNFASLKDGTLSLARKRRILKKRSRQAAIDSTGYESGHTSVYYSKRCGLEKSHYPKLTIVCDIENYLYLSAVPDIGPLPDDIEFKEAVSEAFLSQPFDVLLADAGYDSEANHAFIHEHLGAESIIPPRRGRKTGRPPLTPYRLRMALEFPSVSYGQRWQVESCFSQDKRRFGSALRGRSPESQYREMYLRVLIHNLAIIRRLNPSFQHSRSDPFSSRFERVCQCGSRSGPEVPYWRCATGRKMLPICGNYSQYRFATRLVFHLPPAGMRFALFPCA